MFPKEITLWDYYVGKILEGKVLNCDYLSTEEIRELISALADRFVEESKKRQKKEVEEMLAVTNDFNNKLNKAVAFAREGDHE